MPLTTALNRTIDSISPLIDYSAEGWNATPVDNTTDPNAYRNGTAVQTSITGSSAKFAFNGTSVWYVLPVEIA